jgi:hypothetical protein
VILCCLAWWICVVLVGGYVNCVLIALSHEGRIDLSKEVPRWSDIAHKRRCTRQVKGGVVKGRNAEVGHDFR